MSKPAPLISIVTPSFNQAPFLQETINSVLGQTWPKIEYIIMDGGSTDGSVDIIRRHADRLKHWESNPDAGQYDAINRGFAHTTGEIMAWLNSDDKYLPWTFSVVGEIFSSLPEVEWISSCYPLYWDGSGRAVSCRHDDGFNREGFLRGEYLPNAGWWARSYIMQECTFWRRSLWERAGGKLDVNFKLAADFELWARFYQHTELYGVETPLGGFRMHGAQKTGRQMEVYLQEAKQILQQHGGRPPGPIRSFLLKKRARLLTWLQRTQNRRFGPRPARHLCLHNGQAGGWTIGG